MNPNIFSPDLRRNKNFPVHTLVFLFFLLISAFTLSCSSSETTTPSTVDTSNCTVVVGTGTYQYTINNYTFCQDYPVYDWNSTYNGLSGIATSSVSISVGDVQSFAGHYYSAVYVSTGNVSWVQAAYLAEKLGGYLASINSSTENDFVFSLVDDGEATPCVVTYSGTSNTPSYQDASCTTAHKYFWHFSISTQSEHNGVSIGPFLGGFQPDSAVTSTTDTAQKRLTVGNGWMAHQ